MGGQEVSGTATGVPLTGGQHLDGFQMRRVVTGKGNCPDCGLYFERLGSHRCVPSYLPPEGVPPPLCECGCGEEVHWQPNGRTYSRWRPGHHQRRMRVDRT